MAKRKQPKSDLFCWILFITLMTASSSLWYFGYQYKLFALPVFVVLAYGATFWITACVMDGEWHFDGFGRSNAINYVDSEPTYGMRDGFLIDIHTGERV